MPRLAHILALATAALALIACPVRALADTIGFHLHSSHLPKQDFNNNNPGMYYRTDAGWTAGFYRNSLRRESVYAGYTWKYGRLDVTTALVTGYFRSVQPLVVPSITLFTYRGVTTRVAYIPKVEKRIGSQVFHLMVEF